MSQSIFITKKFETGYLRVQNVMGIGTEYDFEPLDASGDFMLFLTVSAANHIKF